MNERHRISLRESAPGNPPDILDRVKDAIDELFDYSVSAAGNYVKGKGSQETARAAEVRAKALSHLGNLDLERQKLIAERDQVIREDRQKMYELRTQRLTAIIDRLTKLKEIGVDIQMEVVIGQLLRAMEEY